MSHNPLTTEERIASAKPAELSSAEEAHILKAVRERITSVPVPSPFSPSFILFPKTMIPIVLLLALTLGAGGTVAASDSARPGDILFPLDRAVEDFRLSFAGDEEKQQLRIKFADERLREFNTIAGEDDDELSGTLTEAEADIFTDETVVKLEAGDKKVTFITDADTREEIIDVIQDRYGFSEEEIEAVLNVEEEDRESTSDDRDEENTDRERLEDALDALADFIEDNRDAASSSPEVLTALALIESRILDRSAFFPEEIRVKVRDDRARYEVRGEDGERVRVEVKDGEVRIKSKDNDDDDDRDEDEDDDRDDDRDEDEDDDNRDEDEALEIEADVFTDITTVKVEINDRKTSFTTDADTREEVIDAIQARFPELSESEIDAALELEVEDRASRTDDVEDDNDDNDDRDEDRDDDDSDDDREDEEELEIEAEVHSSSTSVEVEIDGIKTRFSTTATTREGIVDAIAAKFAELSKSEIDAALELEFDDEDEDEDEDEDDDDRRGRGGDDDRDDEEDDD